MRRYVQIHTISYYSYCIVYLYDDSKDRVMTIHEVTTPEKSNEELTNGVDMVLLTYSQAQQSMLNDC